MLQEARFIKRKQKFKCEVCGQEVDGNGYTNHCPRCMASKHVDNNPGDRACTCHGIMEPIGIEYRHGKEYVIQRCIKCGHTRPNKVDSSDNRDTVYLIARGGWNQSAFQRKNKS